MRTKIVFITVSALTIVVALALEPVDEAYSKEVTDGKASIMTREEGASVRKMIYQNGLCTCIQTDPLGPYREVSLRKEIVDLHKKKRVATLRLLLEIVKGGSPLDARAAGSIAVALEESPRTAVSIARISLDLFDKVDSKATPTIREHVVERVEIAVAKAERETK